MVKTIAMIHPNICERGGAERKLLLVSKALQASGFTVTIFCRNFNREKTFGDISDGLRIIQLTASTKTFWLFRCFVALFKMRPDMVVCHNYPANIPTSLYGLTCRVKTIWVCNEVAVSFNRKQSFYWRFYYGLEALLNKQLGKVIANSTYTAGEIKKYYNIDADIIRSGVETNFLCDNKEIGNAIRSLADKSYLLVVTRLEKHKNLEFLPTLAEAILPHLLVLAGSGSMKNCIEELTKLHSNLIYVGTISDQEKYFLYAHARLTAFLPHDEPLGVTVMESLVQNTPVVAFRSGGPIETLKDKIQGALCDTDEDFITQCRLLMQSSSKLPKHDGFDYVEEFFSNNRMEKDFINVVTKEFHATK